MLTLVSPGDITMLKTASPGGITMLMVVSPGMLTLISHLVFTLVSPGGITLSHLPPKLGSCSVAYNVLTCPVISRPLQYNYIMQPSLLTCHFYLLRLHDRWKYCFNPRKMLSKIWFSETEKIATWLGLGCGHSWSWDRVPCSSTGETRVNIVIPPGEKTMVTTVPG